MVDADAIFACGSEGMRDRTSEMFKKKVGH
jgi:hypothetical protein